MTINVDAQLVRRRITFGPPVSVHAVHLLLLTDENYVRYATVSLASVRKNTSASIAAHIFVSELTPAIAEAAQIAATKLDIYIEIYVVDSLAFNAIQMSNHFSRATYFRMMAGEILPLRRLIYLDCDVIVQDDIEELHKIDIGDAAVAGVSDWLGPVDANHRFGLPVSEPYLNAGVLVIDASTWKALKIYEKSIQYIAAHRHKLRWHDQDLIHILLAGRKVELPSKWNVQQMPHANASLAHVMGPSRQFLGIFHANGPIKYWTRWADPWARELFLEYAQLVDVNINPREPTHLERAFMARQGVSPDILSRIR